MNDVSFPLMNSYSKTRTFSERLDDYRKLGTRLFKEDIEECYEYNGKPIYSASYIKAGKLWACLPKIGPENVRLDWVAVENAFTYFQRLSNPDSTQGYIVVLFGPDRCGKTVTARWMSDARALIKWNKIVPGFVSIEQFTEFGAYKNKVNGLVSALRGHEDGLNEKDDDWPLSVLDGVGNSKLTASETFALFATFSACVDRHEFDLVITTPAVSMQEFVACLHEGEYASGIINRLNERCVAVEFRQDRVGECPFLDEEGELAEGYGISEFDQRARDIEERSKKFNAEFNSNK